MIEFLQYLNYCPVLFLGYTQDLLILRPRELFG
jgi:hypothetical protein